MSAPSDDAPDALLPAVIRAEARSRPSVSELARADGAALLERLGAAFVRDTRATWWWTALREPTSSIPYADAIEGLAVVRRLLPANPRVYLIVSDDQPPGAWPVFVGALEDILVVLCETRLFEYALADAGEQWMLFDNHHDTLVLSGADLLRGVGT